MKVTVYRVIEYGFEVFKVYIEDNHQSTFWSKEMALTRAMMIEYKLGVR